MFLTFIRGALAQFCRAFRQIGDPQPPGGSTSAEAPDPRREYAAQTLSHIGVDILVAFQQPFYVGRVQDADRRATMRA